MRHFLFTILYGWAVVSIGIFVTGCQIQKQNVSGQTQTAANPIQETPDQLMAPVVIVPPNTIFRVKAGTDQPFTDSSGNVWLPDQGFDGGDVIDRDPATVITNTDSAGLYLTEHYGMNSFSCKIANGKYLVKLYFAETFEGISGPGQRVFSFNVQGHEFKDFDVWAKAGGPYRAYIESVPVEVTNEVFRIDFVTQTENPEINAIEIIPQS